MTTLRNYDFDRKNQVMEMGAKELLSVRMPRELGRMLTTLAVRIH